MESEKEGKKYEEKGLLEINLKVLCLTSQRGHRLALWALSSWPGGVGAPTSKTSVPCLVPQA